MLSFLAEILFSAILWGSLITWWLWRKRKTDRGRFRHGLLTFGMGWFGLHTAIALYGLLIPPSGRLIDANTGAPIKNTRVVVTWLRYPLPIFVSGCSGQQAHLTDNDGGFAFPLAPAPTLFVGTLGRSLHPQVPGRVLNGRSRIFPQWLLGDIPIRHFEPGRERIDSSPGVNCKALPLTAQYRRGLLRGEEHPFDLHYREACIEKQPWTLTDMYLSEMMSSSWLLGRRLSPTETITVPPSLHLLEEYRRLLALQGCPGHSLCTTTVEPAVRDKFCAYFATRDSEGNPR
ncbi:MAG: hypothetical protein SGI99_00465 [Pseudomonadota bacterium]|nr:hypothetical protein [Pseudomonadota bacterium]